MADTQGAIGYALQQNLYNDFRRLGLDKEVATVVTQVEVDPADPAFSEPSKPIGGYMDEAAATRRIAEGWRVAEEPGKGWRRLVASPRPRRIVESPIVRRLIDAGFVVIAAGGGGIPVVRDESGFLKGVEAVVDKDLVSALLASALDASTLIISTTVEKAALDFGTPQQRWIDRLTVDEAKGYLDEGVHFGRGSMAPKIRAIIKFIADGGRAGLITNGENLERAVAGETGTLITGSS